MVNYLELVIGNIASRKKRSFLTIIAIVIGVCAVVSLVSLGVGLQVTINEQFEMMGTDKLMIIPGGSLFGMIGGGASELTEHDVDIIEDTNGIELVGAMVYKSARVEYKGDTKYTFVSGLPTDDSREIIESMQRFKVI